MNYRHAFHAGNFADVFKHAVLCRILHHLRQKDGAFRVIDTHAGAGIYDLAASEATQSGEWQDGIEKLLAARLAPAAADLLSPYLDVVGALNESGAVRLYPGSPALVRAWLRGDDRLIACETQDDAYLSLTSHLRSDPRIKTLQIDGWTAMTAYVPPKERRGLVLVDPPYERDDEYRNLARTLGDAHRKWATGGYMLWYPVKGRAEPDALAKSIRKLGIAKVLRAELLVRRMTDVSRLNGSGLVIVNPPWTLEKELSVLLPALAAVLGHNGQGSFKLDWLAGETAP